MDDDLLDLYDRMDRLMLDLIEERDQHRRCPEHLPETYWNEFTSRRRAALHAAVDHIEQAHRAMQFDTKHDYFMQDHGITWR
ncbi:hypothetical protein ABZ639_22130 [Saccharomonospora sp. NPDC006951]